MPQLMPSGLLDTVPTPSPALTTVSSGPAKIAVTVFASSTVTVHVVAVPVHPPPVKPPKVEPVAGAAVNWTIVPAAYSCEQSPPQSMPVGELVTVPVPVGALPLVPPLTTVRAGLASANVAVTVVAAVTVMVQVVEAPVHPPPVNPVNVEPLAAGEAVSVTNVPGA